MRGDRHLPPLRQSTGTGMANGRERESVGAREGGDGDPLNGFREGERGRVDQDAVVLVVLVHVVCHGGRGFRGGRAGDSRADRLVERQAFKVQIGRAHV